MVLAPIFVALNLNHIPYILRLQAFRGALRSSKLISYISYIYHSLKCQSQGEDKPCLVENQGILVVGWTMCRFYGGSLPSLPGTVCHQVYHKQSTATSRKSNDIQTCFKAFGGSQGIKEFGSSCGGRHRKNDSWDICARPRLTYPRPHPRVAASLLPTVRPRSACGA